MSFLSIVDDWRACDDWMNEELCTLSVFCCEDRSAYDEVAAEADASCAFKRSRWSWISYTVRSHEAEHAGFWTLPPLAHQSKVTDTMRKFYPCFRWRSGWIFYLHYSWMNCAKNQLSFSMTSVPLLHTKQMLSSDEVFSVFTSIFCNVLKGKCNGVTFNLTSLHF